jgi:hypothetical protein
MLKWVDEAASGSRCGFPIGSLGRSHKDQGVQSSFGGSRHSMQCAPRLIRIYAALQNDGFDETKGIAIWIGMVIVVKPRSGLAFDPVAWAFT